MFENPRRSRQARNFTTNVSKILDLKSSSEQIFFRKLSLGAPEKFTLLYIISSRQLCCIFLADIPCGTKFLPVMHFHSAFLNETFGGRFHAFSFFLEPKFNYLANHFEQKSKFKD